MLKNLKKLREERRLTQKQLAEVILVSQQSINKYENHGVEPDIATVIRLADYFSVSVDYLIGRTTVRDRAAPSDAYTLSKEEAGVLQRYRYLTPRQKRSIELILQNYTEK